MVRHQRERAEREHLVEGEEREEVRRERHAHHRSYGHREEEVEPGLVLLVMAPHVADRIERRDDPQEGGDQREQQPERLDFERELDPRNHLEERDARHDAVADRSQHRIDHPEERPRRDERRGLPEVGSLPQRQHEEAAHQGQEEGSGRQSSQTHDPTPRSVWAASIATPEVRLASIPK